MKAEKYEKAPYIMKTTRHFNHVSTHARLSAFLPGFSLVRPPEGQVEGSPALSCVARGLLTLLQSQFLHLLNR